MVRLKVAFFYWCLLAGALGESLPAQEPAAPGSEGRTAMERRHAAYLQRLNQLVQSKPTPLTGEWVQESFGLLRRLEHASRSDFIVTVWEHLAADDQDWARTNLILYCRRHDLPLPSPAMTESAGETLERCLALWGQSRWKETRKALQQAVRSFPEDLRLRNNLLWLEFGLRTEPQEASTTFFAPPGELLAERPLAFAVLAARAARD